MVNYSNGKIYKIEPTCDHDEGDVYIGSTTKKYLSQRMDTHRYNYKRWLKGGYHYVTSFNLFEKYGVNNCRVVLLENVNAKSKDELTSKEAYFIRTMKCINKIVPGRTHVEYRQDNIEKLKEYRKEYCQKNAERIKQYKKEYRSIDKTCDICDCAIGINNFSRHTKSIKHRDNLKSVSDKPILTAMRAVNYVPNRENYE